MELSLPPLPPKHRKGKPINWTPEMILYLRNEFAHTYNKVLAKHLRIGWRSVVRKARELGLEKEIDFLQKNKAEIQSMARIAHSPHPHKGDKGWCVPNSEATRFYTGQKGPSKELLEKVHQKRRETIARERFRLRIGLEPLTKMKLKY
jgi:hypothetical protein